MTSEPLVYSIPEACERARVGKSALYVAIAGGEIEIVKVGDRTLIEPAELRRWVSPHLRVNFSPGSQARRCATSAT
jgi:excisionase family DNA binding protein